MAISSFRRICPLRRIRSYPDPLFPDVGYRADYRAFVAPHDHIVDGNAEYDCAAQHDKLFHRRPPGDVICSIIELTLSETFSALSPKSMTKPPMAIPSNTMDIITIICFMLIPPFYLFNSLCNCPR